MKGQKKSKYVFYTSCIGVENASDISNMVESSSNKKVTWEEFSNHVRVDEIKFLFGNLYNYDDEDNNAGLLFQEDGDILFYKSEYGGIPCYYLVYSGIEYVFMPQIHFSSNQKKGRNNAR